MPLTILVAEADEVVRGAVGWWLSAHRHRVLTAADVDSALWALDLETVDVVVVDATLPARDAREITRRAQHAPVIVLGPNGTIVDSGGVVRLRASSMSALADAVSAVAARAGRPALGVRQAATGTVSAAA